MASRPTKRCTKCGQEKPLEEMDTVRKGGRTYYRSRCRTCNTARIRQWDGENPEGVEARYDRKAAYACKIRRDPALWHKAIYADCRASDRRRGMDNDLTPEHIRSLIDQGCSYCGEAKLRMTLDRIDNERGHTQDNVVPACIRCNYIRRNMPYEAWLVIAKGIRKAREHGLFGEWVGRAKKLGAG